MSFISTITAPHYNHSNKGFPSLVNEYHPPEACYGADKPSSPYGLTSEPTWKKVLSVAKETLNKIISGIKQGLKKVDKYLKKILKVIPVIFTGTEKKVEEVLAYLGLMSIQKAYENWASFIKETGKLEKCIKINDIEGVVCSTLEILVKPLEIADNLLKYGKSLDKIAGLPWISLFSIVTFPLSLAIDCYNTIKSIWDTIMMSIELSQMPNWDSPDSCAKFKDYLEEKVGVTNQERNKIAEEICKEYQVEIEKLKNQREPKILLVSKNQLRLDGSEMIAKEMRSEFKRRIQLIKDRKHNCLKRHTDKKIVLYMLNAKQFIEKNPDREDISKGALVDLKKLSGRKLTILCVGTILDIADLIMTVASEIFSQLHPAISMTLTLAKTGLSLWKDFVPEKHWLTIDLSNPEFLKTSEKQKSKIFQY